MHTCQITGDTGALEEAREDDLGDIPDGWIVVTFQRRVHNPKYRMIQLAMRQDLAETENSLRVSNYGEGDEAKIGNRMALAAVSVEARYRPLLAVTPEFLIETDVVVISDPSQNPMVQAGIEQIQEALGMEAPEEPEAAETVEEAEPADETTAED